MSIMPREHALPISAGQLHVVDAGPEAGQPLLFLHGWPEDWSAWKPVMEHAASEGFRTLAIDLPGVGRSRLNRPNGEKAFLAGLIREAVEALGLERLTVVGHDCGGMIAFAYLRQFTDLQAAVIMDTVIPGVDPWTSVLANPYIWHFAFHSIPALPELLVRHEPAAYFDYFYDTIAARPDAIGADARARYREAYRSPEALAQGFEFYRAFAADAAANGAVTGLITTPLLYVRGEREGGEIDVYANGLRAAGLTAVSTAVVPGSGHFAPEENPAATWATIAAFLA
jgi:pimeloyl-ACP methyl ester carboxylesterase